MATINDITNAAGYQGSGNLGGGFNNVIDIDIKPLQDLAKYTVIYNQAEYQQRQKDAEARALELADIAKVDFASIEPKWRDEIATKYKEVTDYAASNPEVFNYQKNPQGYLEYQKKKNELMQAANAGKQNQILLTARKQAIANATDVNLKNVLQKELDADLSKTGLYTPLPVEQKYSLEYPTLPKSQQLEFTVYQRNPNDNVLTENAIFDMGQINAQSNIAEFQDMMKPLDQNSVEFTSATVEEQLKMKSQDARNSVLRKNGYMKMGEVLQSIISNPAYQDEDGKTDVNKLLADPKTKPYMQVIADANAKIKGQYDRIKSGAYSDKNGNTIIFDNQRFKERDYALIDVTDGLSGAEITKIFMLANAPSDKQKTTIQQTDNDIQRQKTAVDWYQAVTGRLNSQKSSGKNSKEPDSIQDPAILFGKHIQRLGSFFEKNGNKIFTVPFNSTDADTRKAIGLTEGQSVEYRRDGSYIIQNDADKSIVSSGTLENIKKGYIDAVKSGNSDKGVNSEKFQQQAEDGFTSIYGTNNASIIFDGLINKDKNQPSTADKSSTSQKSKTYKGLDANGNPIFE